MAIVVEATYENGVLRPAEPLPLAEHEKVRVTVEGVRAPAETPPLNMAEWLDAIEAECGLVEGPVDGAAELDHYLYGAPKRGDRRGG
jgi:predicted DNA-binding antitoxin AbrB/MazE fold protein